MIETFFHALVEGHEYPSGNSSAIWQPNIAVSVVAVFSRTSDGFPNSDSVPDTDLLVRNFRLDSRDSATRLVKKISSWALGHIETTIAQKLSRRSHSSAASTTEAGWIAPTGSTISAYSSFLVDLLDTGEAALSTLSSAARPILVVATDARSLACDGSIDVFCGRNRRVDVPVVVLDLSDPDSHNVPAGDRVPVADGGAGDTVTSRIRSIINYDPHGSAFPLHLSDDTQALFHVAHATGGCFFDSNLLYDAARTQAGQPPAGSPFTLDPYFSFKNHSFRVNAVQWYTLLSLSPLTEVPSSLGRMPPPKYLQEWRKRETRKLDQLSGQGSLQSRGGQKHLHVKPDFGAVPRAADASGHFSCAQTSVPVIFSMYTMNPIRIKSFLFMRVREGFRVKQYGLSTQDPDKVFLHFFLSFERGTTIHYELSYRARPDFDNSVGSAHVKIQLSGDSAFVQFVKKEFRRDQEQERLLSPRGSRLEQLSARLCQILRWIRREDEQQAFFTPLKWTDQLSSADSLFLKRLGLLDSLQRGHHFRRFQFDCVCVGRMPYIHDDTFLSEFRDMDDGRESILDAVGTWSTQSIRGTSRFVRIIPAAPSIPSKFCLLEVKHSSVVSRVFSVLIDVFGGSDVAEVLLLVAGLKNELQALKDVEVPPLQMNDFLLLQLISIGRGRLDGNFSGLKPC
jgi:hypothetical protein